MGAAVVTWSRPLRYGWPWFGMPYGSDIEAAIKIMSHSTSDSEHAPGPAGRLRYAKRSHGTFMTSLVLPTALFTG
ncbi:hypothetical protein G7K_6264-t1 [Saitoella complicata NRRL Y-17804]|uniref:Uncharacterized protein n=1 Tax=Saitoella complicata (strain BCRC 22490 / CBS 7301 / JCM 7358 / NBRC 10748 / NRRL Y-17804) TaxID=698492 RepID=A0A0E9NR74_SAICN|nr:hypothetical protein G7K_6264-t1 [Saitoella complicata NRRL Y-17804]